MKTLYESLLDDEEDLVNDDNIIQIYMNEINRWLRCYANNIKITKINTDKFPIEINIAPKFGNYIEIERDIPDCLNINKCVGNLTVGKYITTLKGMPQEIIGDFSCSGNDNLTDLKYGPNIVKGDYTCTFMKNLTSLKGCPKKCKNFYCGANPKLKNLIGGPEKVDGDYNCCECDTLTSLKGCAKKIGWNFNLRSCSNLKDIKDIPKYIPGNLLLANSGWDLNDFKEYCTVGNM